MAKSTYEIEPSMEAALVALLVTDQQVFNRIGFALDPEMLPTESAQLVVRVTQLHARETNGKPCSPRVVSQRLRALRTAGQLIPEDAVIAIDWLSDGIAKAKEWGDREALIHEMARVVRYHMHRAAAEKLMQLVGKRADDMGPVLQLLETARGLGRGQQEQDLRIDENVLDYLSTVKIDRIPLGIPDLDESFRGGIGRGELVFFIGGPGDGKSMALCQFAVEAVRSGRGVYIVTLELSRDRWIARYLAAHLNVPTNQFLDNELTDEQKAELRVILKDNRAVCRKFPAGATFPSDIWAAFDKANEKLEVEGADWRYEVLVVDYADKLAFSKEMKGKYDGSEQIYEALRLGAEERNGWAATASQAKDTVTGRQPRSRKAKKDEDDSKLQTLDEMYIKGLYDAADSLYKSRVADVVLTINTLRRRTKLFVAKDRNGQSEGFLTEAYETDFAYGKLTLDRSWNDDREEEVDNGCGGFQFV